MLFSFGQHGCWWATGQLIEHSDYLQPLELAFNTEAGQQSCKLLFHGEYMLTSASMLISLCVYLLFKKAELYIDTSIMCRHVCAYIYIYLWLKLWMLHKVGFCDFFISGHWILSLGGGEPPFIGNRIFSLNIARPPTLTIPTQS